MNATKFYVVVLFIGLVCANVGAIRKIEGESKEAKLGISNPKTATINGFGTQLSVTTSTDSFTSGSGYSFVDAGSGGLNGYSSGFGSGSTGGSVTTDGSIATGSSSSGSGSQGSSSAEASPGGVTTSNGGSGGASSSTSGSSGPNP